MICIDPVCWIAAAFYLLLLPFDWLLSAAAAAVVHESAHIFTVLLFGGSIYRVRISVNGCVIECGAMTDLGTVCSIFAGPVCSLMLLCFRKIAPQIAVCGLFQGMFNLLPILPLDGGRILQILLSHLLPRRTALIMRVIKCFICFTGVGLLIWLFGSVFLL